MCSQCWKHIIKNPIEKMRGYKNADNGIALRGPLSQFFSGLYLNSFDSANQKQSEQYLTSMVGNASAPAGHSVSLTNQELLESLVHVVGEIVTKLAIRRNHEVVYSNLSK
jgi:hypothetical protein